MFITLKALWDGAIVTLEITFLAGVLGLVLSFVAGIARLSSRPVIRWPAAVYVEVFRGISALAQLFWIFFVLPFFGINLSPLVAGVTALGLTVGAYGAEVVRGAIWAVPYTQTEAAVALNFTIADRLRMIIVPQAVIGMLPPFGNLLIQLLKGTALVSLITIEDLTFQAMLVRTRLNRTAEAFLAIMVIYFVMAYGFTRSIRWAEYRLSKGMDIGRAASSTLVEPIG